MGGRRLGPHFWPPPGRPNVCEPTEAAYDDMTPGEKATLMLRNYYKDFNLRTESKFIIWQAFQTKSLILASVPRVHVEISHFLKKFGIGKRSKTIMWFWQAFRD